MKVLQFVLIALMFTVSFSGFAHDGHNHSSTYASLSHLLWLAPIFVGLCFLYSRIINQLHKIDP